MKTKNVNITSTAMNSEGTNGKNSAVRLPHQPKTLMIADLLFIFKLFKHLPNPVPPENSPVMHLPVLLAQKLPVHIHTKLNAWQELGSIVLLDFCDETLLDILRIKNHPGLQCAELMALLEARRRKQTVVACAEVMVQMAKKLRVPVINGNVLSAPFDFTDIPATSTTRVKKTNIILSGVPAPIAGNKLNNVRYEHY
jgi:hypothetical protein